MIPSVLLFAILAQAPPAAQTPARPAAAMSVEEATTLTQGWAFLAQGELARAVEKATEAMAIAPRSPAALALAIEVEILRGGAGAAVDFYERWLGGRTLEEPTIVRRLAVAMLREMGADAANPTARAEALQILAAEGDAWGDAELARLSAAGGTRELIAMAALGNAAAVSQLSEGLGKAGTPSPAVIAALGRSKLPVAASAVRPFLTHERPDVRAAVIRALAAAESRSDIPALKLALKDQTAYVQLAAAASLVQLGDPAGVEPLREAARSPGEELRLAAAEALSKWAGEDWQAIARPLLGAQDPLVRAGAAQLMAPEDPAAAAATFEVLQGSTNPAVRERVFQLWSESALLSPADLKSARAHLRHGERIARMSACRLILALTR